MQVGGNEPSCCCGRIPCGASNLTGSWLHPRRCHLRLSLRRRNGLRSPLGLSLTRSLRLHRHRSLLLIRGVKRHIHHPRQRSTTGDFVLNLSRLSKEISRLRLTQHILRLLLLALRKRVHNATEHRGIIHVYIALLRVLDRSLDGRRHLRSIGIVRQDRCDVGFELWVLQTLTKLPDGLLGDDAVLLVLPDATGDALTQALNGTRPRSPSLRHPLRDELTADVLNPRCVGHI